MNFALPHIIVYNKLLTVEMLKPKLKKVVAKKIYIKQLSKNEMIKSNYWKLKCKK
jgi:hypothetical protein